MHRRKNTDSHYTVVRSAGSFPAFKAAHTRTRICTLSPPTRVPPTRSSLAAAAVARTQRKRGDDHAGVALCIFFTLIQNYEFSVEQCTYFYRISNLQICTINSSFLLYYIRATKDKNLVAVEAAQKARVVAPKINSASCITLLSASLHTRDEFRIAARFCTTATSLAI